MHLSLSLRWNIHKYINACNLDTHRYQPFRTSWLRLKSVSIISFCISNLCRILSFCKVSVGCHSLHARELMFKNAILNQLVYKVPTCKICFSKRIKLHRFMLQLLFVMAELIYHFAYKCCFLLNNFMWLLQDLCH